MIKRFLKANEMIKLLPLELVRDINGRESHVEDGNNILYKYELTFDRYLVLRCYFPLAYRETPW